MAEKPKFTYTYCFSRHKTCFLFEKYPDGISAFISAVPMILRGTR